MAAGDVTTRAVCSAPAAAPLILKDGPDRPHVRPSGACLYFSQLALEKGFVKKKKEEKRRRGGPISALLGSRASGFLGRWVERGWGGAKIMRGGERLVRKEKGKLQSEWSDCKTTQTALFGPPKLQSECARTIVGRKFNPTL